MWPWKRKQTAFEAELDAVKALPDPTALAQWDNDPLRKPSADFATTEPLVPPIEREQNQGIYAQPPIIDRFPTIIGQNLTGAYVSSAMRLCNSGWRYQYVDLLDELLENDPDTRGVVRARILGIACGRYNVEPALLGESATGAERDITKRVADEYALDFSNIPCRTQRIQQLAWGDWYAAAGHEVVWEHPPGKWEFVDLCHIHSRRLNYTNPVTWELYVYDQGLVGPGSDYMGPTVGVYGLPVSKFPGKFIVHTPSLSGQYPTRDGEGRYVAAYMLMKRMVTRCSAQDFERVIRPWVLGYYNREMPQGQKEPFADKLDIQILAEALQILGAGNMNSATLPNSVKIDVIRQAAALSAVEFLSFLNRSIAKSLLGQSFTTEPGPNGNLATAEVADKNTTKILVYSANALCDTLRRDLAVPWLRLNYPALSRKFAPRHVVNVQDLPTPQELMQMVVQGTGVDMPIDIDDVGQRTTLKVLAPGDTTGRRTRMLNAKEGPNPPETGQQPPKPTDSNSEPLLEQPQNGKAKRPVPQA